jgi:hypothetical protein
MDLLKSKEFWYGAAALYLVLKFGPSLPVVGPTLAKIKA